MTALQLGGEMGNVKFEHKLWICSIPFPPPLFSGGGEVGVLVDLFYLFEIVEYRVMCCATDFEW